MEIALCSSADAETLDLELEQNGKTKFSAKPRKKRRPPRVPWKKPKDMPKRPLSAYNLFFQHEREQLLRSSSSMDNSIDHRSTPGRSHQKTSGIGFANLAKTIAAKWKTIDPKARSKFESLAAVEKTRYTKEIAAWRQKKKKEAETLKSNTSEDEPQKQTAAIPPTKERPKPERVSSDKNVPSSPPLSRPEIMRRSSEGNLNGHAQDGILRHLEPLPYTTLSAPSLVRSSTSASSLATTMTPSAFQPPHRYHEHTLQLRGPPIRSFSDSILNFHHLDSFESIRSCEEIAASAAGEDKHPSSVFSSALPYLSSTLDDDTVDFLTNLRFDSL